MNILFVCTANVSRSFLAERVLSNELGSLDGVFVSSAGLHAFPGSPPDPMIVAYLQEKGIPAEGHSARQVGAQDIQWADMILAMQKVHAVDLEKTWPQARGKVKLLGSYMPGVLEGDDILDAYGKSPYHYRLVQSQITLAVKALARSLARDQPFGSHSRRRNEQTQRERETGSR
jgi:protein-tyrosine phosphatase